MNTIDPAGPESAVHFRVAAIDHYAFPEPVRETHTVLRVHYLNPADRLRGAAFDLPPGTYVAYRDAIDAALTSGATYWVVWGPDAISGIPHQRGTTAAERLLQAIADRQIVPPETED